ncbi:hypothetical protein SAMN05660443_2510 [Marinospirillum celere]|uniref:Lipoprotein n=1 Tax=Marinospirillum celere TaxID=1122252 RepID=A0A1I1IZ99_9GAMM|nr:hypothetical protein [Marinospirillum celere]SFC39708.1 hypothetical protein SAMN05660443_2510 [Marinospirillum celere]
MDLLQRLLMVVFAGLLLVGCAKGTSDDFFVQPEWAGYLERVPANLGFEPAVTDWERAPSLETSHDECASPQQTTEAWAAFHGLIGPEKPDNLTVDLRTRHQQDTATGLVQRWGFKDDSVAGTDYQLTLEKTNGCWQPTKVETRHYCRRGKTEGNLCI